MPRKKREVVESAAVVEEHDLDFEREADTKQMPAEDLAYDESYYSGQAEESQYLQGYGDFEPWTSFFKHVAKNLKRLYKPKSAVDAGAALGILVKYMNEVGIPTKGFDSSPYAVNNAVTPIQHGDLADQWPQEVERFQLVTCIEVLEHIPADKAEVAVANLCSLVAPGGTLVFSSVPPEKNIESAFHVNVQPEAYWLDLFAKHGFKKQKDDVKFPGRKYRPVRNFGGGALLLLYKKRLDDSHRQPIWRQPHPELGEAQEALRGKKEHDKRSIRMPCCCRNSP